MESVEGGNREGGEVGKEEETVMPESFFYGAHFFHFYRHGGNI
jgi:hypothetical protein